MILLHTCPISRQVQFGTSFACSYYEDDNYSLLNMMSGAILFREGYYPRSFLVTIMKFKALLVTQLLIWAQKIKLECESTMDKQEIAEHV